jgi:hypothetical protein
MNRFSRDCVVTFLLSSISVLVVNPSISSEGVSSYVDDSALLPCAVGNAPTWTKLTGSIANPTFTDIDWNNPDSRFSRQSPTALDLLIVNLTLSDSGLYICQDNGGPSQYVTLSVKDRPIAPTTPLPEVANLNWLYALFIFLGLCLPLLLVCIVYGFKNVSENKSNKRRGADDRDEKLLSTSA